MNNRVASNTAYRAGKIDPASRKKNKVTVGDIVAVVVTLSIIAVSVVIVAYDTITGGQKHNEFPTYTNSRH